MVWSTVHSEVWCGAQYIVKCCGVWCGVQYSVVWSTIYSEVWCGAQYIVKCGGVGYNTQCGVEYNRVWCDDCGVWSEEPWPLRDNRPPERDDTTQGLASLLASLQSQSKELSSHILDLYSNMKKSNGQFSSATGPQESK